MKVRMVVCGLLAMAAMACAQAGVVIQAVMAPDGKTVMGYVDPGRCVTWAAPSKMDRVSQMTHDRWILVVGEDGRQTLAYTDVANKFAEAQVIAGVGGWRLPTLEEGKSFMGALGSPNPNPDINIPEELKLQRDTHPGPYWTKELSANMVQAAAVRPGPLVQWYTRAGAKSFVWPVKDGCRALESAAINPFGTPAR